MAAQPQSQRTQPTHPVSLRRFLEATEPAYAALPMRAKAWLAGALVAAAFRKTRHYDDPEAIPLHWENRRRAIRTAAEANAVHARLGWFERTAPPRPGVAAAWALTEKGSQMLADWFELAEEARKQGLEDGNGNKARKPREAIARYTKGGARARKPKNTDLCVAVDVDAEALTRLNGACKAWLWDYADEAPAGTEYAIELWRSIQAGRGPRSGADKTRERVRRAQSQALMIQIMAQANEAPGHAIPQTYVEAPSGRLYCSNTVNLQNAQREVKHAALSGCYEYDFENCHWSLLAQMADAAGVELEAVPEYLQAKKRWRESVALQAAVSVDDAKMVLTAMIYGAGLEPEPGKALHDALGPDALGRLRQCQEVMALHADVKRAREAVIQAHRRRTDGRVVNAARRVFDGRKVDSRRRSAATLAHILQGAESEALRAAMDAATDLRLIQHDGFTTATRQDRKRIEAAILERVGYRLELSEDRI